MATTRYKGMRVFPPDSYRHLSHILESWRKTAISYGYREYQTPIIDPSDLYTDKTSDEIVKEQTYAFSDRGGREVLLRPEITPGASAMMVDLQKNRQVHAPYKTFSIGPVFRYERAQRGRSREHIQFNADLFGEKDPWSDAEVISVAFAALTASGLSSDDIVVRVNDRRALETTLERLGIEREARTRVTRLLDRRAKMDPADVERQLQECTNVSLHSIDKALEKEPDTVATVRELLDKNINALYDPLIVRGFDYYTGIVFEFFMTDQSIMQRSLVGGGRYDGLIASYGGSDLPAVGFGMGDTVLLDCLEACAAKPPKQSPFTVLYTDDPSRLKKARDAAAVIRRALPITFLGVVPKNKQSALHKRYAEQGATHIIRSDGSGYTIRTVQTKTDETARTPNDVASFLKKRWQQSFVDRLKFLFTDS